MSENAPDPDQFVGAAPTGDARPDDYTSNDQTAAVSEDTGTVYDPSGEPAMTPHDEELDEDEQ